jgi:hypothetical protein
VPLLTFILAILVCGAFYSLLFIEVAIPKLLSFIPASDSKTLIMMGIYGLPLLIAVIGVFCLLKAGQKRTIGGYT